MGDSMKVKEGQKVLLSFAWATGAEKELLAKFPEVFFMDVVEKTNKEKRSMFIVTGIDGLGKIFSALHVYMPNAKGEAFHWIYNHAMPILWKENIQNVQVILTDGETAMYSPLKNLSHTMSPWNGVKLYRYG